MAKTQLQSSSQQTNRDVKSLLRQDNIAKRFSSIMKDRAPAFMTSIMNVSESTPALKKVGKTNGMSIVRSAAVAASLNLPIDRNLGFAWIVPYGNEAQFQMGYKGFVQLALRTGEYSRLNVVSVYKNQFKSFNALTEELEADFSVPGNGEVVGYAAYMRLVNGFEKTVYWTKDQVLGHGKRYSKSYNKSDAPWKNHEDQMCKKTVLKNMISKWGIMSIDMKRAMSADQAIVRGDDIDNESSFDYADNSENTNTPSPINTEEKKVQTPQQRYNTLYIELAQKTSKNDAEKIINSVVGGSGKKLDEYNADDYANLNSEIEEHIKEIADEQD